MNLDHLERAGIAQERRLYAAPIRRLYGLLGRFRRHCLARGA